MVYADTETVLVPLLTLESFFGWDEPVVVVIVVLESIVAVAALWAFWWLGGRDRWLGNNYYVNQGISERIKPLFAHETILPEYEPPGAPSGRPLRPAEMGVLLRERLEMTDICATIIDLAVRSHIEFQEQDSDASKNADYSLILQPDRSEDLEEFEQRLLNAIFEADVAEIQESKDARPSVLLSDLQGTLWIEMASIKQAIYRELVSDKLFAHDPRQVRFGAAWSMAPARVMLSIFGTVAAGAEAGLALLGLPAVIGFVTLFLIGPAMARRTGLGREMLRRSLGFRLFLVTALPDEPRHLDKEARFHDYMGYAMVLGCAEEWIQRLEDLDTVKRMPAWYRAQASRRSAPWLAQLASSVAEFAKLPKSANATAARTP